MVVKQSKGKYKVQVEDMAEAKMMVVRQERESLGKQMKLWKNGSLTVCGNYIEVKGGNTAEMRIKLAQVSTFYQAVAQAIEDVGLFVADA